MASTKSLMVFFVTMNLSGALMAAHEYKVGDSAGWATNVDYQKWVAGKKFHVGDTIVFLYDKSHHNVKEVTYWNFRSCNATPAIAAYSSGHDSITLRRSGHHFFLCGLARHCQSGQKLAIRVFQSSITDTQSSKPEKASSPLRVLSSGPAIAPTNAAFYG